MGMDKLIVIVAAVLTACGAPVESRGRDASARGGAGGTADTAGPEGGRAAGGTLAGGAGSGSGGTASAGGVVATGGTTVFSRTGGTAVGSGGMLGSGGESAGAATGSQGGSDSGGSATGGVSGVGGSGAGGAVSDAGTGKDVPADDLRTAKDLVADQPTSSVSVYIAGDSTVATYTNSSIHQAGWGQFLQNELLSSAKVVNKAVGGMTARHFIEAGYLDDIVSVIKAGDYLLVQFGTNDGNKTATYTLPGSTTEIPYYLDPATDFKTYLAKYVERTKAKGATTVFVTPPPRHSCNDGETGVRNGLGAYATAMKELGPTLDTPVVDLNAMTVAYLANITCETSGKTFYLVTASGSVDSTHFQESGAKIMAGLVAKGATGISTLAVPLAAYVK